MNCKSSDRHRITLTTAGDINTLANHQPTLSRAGDGKSLIPFVQTTNIAELDSNEPTISAGVINFIQKEMDDQV